MINDYMKLNECINSNQRGWLSNGRTGLSGFEATGGMQGENVVKGLAVCTFTIHQRKVPY